jgi:hypothetical protein
MPRSILVEEFHLTVRAPTGLPGPQFAAIRQTLTDPRFRARLRRAVRHVFRQYAALGNVRVLIGR